MTMTPDANTEQDGSVSRLTIRGLEVTAAPDVSLARRVEALERALTGLVLELVEHGALPSSAPGNSS